MITKYKSNLAALGIAAFSILGSSSITAATIGWADTVTSTNLATASNVLGQPDGVLTGFNDNNGTTTENATYAGFSNTISYDTNDLAALLGVSSSVLNASDVIAFEFNGSASANNNFETSDWVFNDGSNSVSASYVFNTAPADPLITTVGIVSSSAYANFFNFTNPFGSGNIAFILFDIDGQSIVDPFASSFSISLNATGSGSGFVDSPDVDALGVLQASPVPLPPAALLFISGLMGLMGVKFKKQQG